jgi:hypothetical protein
LGKVQGVRRYGKEGEEERNRRKLIQGIFNASI